MSYILDALKKSDKKRQEGKIPDLHTIQIDTAPPEKKKRLFWPYLLLTILIVNGVFLTVFLSPWKKEAPTLVAERVPEKQTSSTLEKTKPAIPEQKLPPANQPPYFKNSSPPTVIKAEQSEPISLSANAKVKVSSNTINTDQTDSSLEITSSTQSDNSNVIAVAPEAIVGKSPVTQVENTSNDQTDTETLTYQEPSQSTINSEEEHLSPPQKTVSLQQRNKANTRIIPPKTDRPTISEREVIDIQQLPPSIQQDLPEFNIAAHVYSKKPASRLVSINGRVFREGHKLSPHLRVEEIVPDGVIFSYKEYLFRVGVFYR